MTRSDLREPTPSERRLLTLLLSSALKRDLPADSLAGARVRTLDDEGSFSVKGVDVQLPGERRVPVEAEAEDADGVAVRALLHVNEDDVPMEVEIYKDDGSPLQQPVDTLAWRVESGNWPPGWLSG